MELEHGKNNSLARQKPHRIAAATGVIIALLTIGLWLGLHVREKRFVERSCQDFSASLTNQIQFNTKAHLALLQGLAQRLDSLGLADQKSWEREAGPCLQSLPALRLIAWVDPSLQTRWKLPAKEKSLERAYFGMKEQWHMAYEEARKERRATFLGPLDQSQGEKGFVAVFPIFAKDQFLGFLSGVLVYQRLFDSWSDGTANDYSIAVLQNNHVIYQHFPEVQTFQERAQVEARVQIEGLAWDIRVSPSRTLLGRWHSSLDKAVLIFGLSLSLLAFLSISRALALHGTRTQMMENRKQHLSLVQEALRESEAHYRATFDQAQESLRESEDRLRMAVEATELGTWDLNVLTGKLTWSARCRAIFEVAPEAPVDYERFLACLHPEDRGRVHEVIQRALDPSGSKQYKNRYRAILPGGAVRWIDAKAQCYFEKIDGKSRAVRLIGTVLDVTERKRVEDAHERLITILETTPDYVATSTLSGQVLYMNKAYRDLVGIAEHADLAILRTQSIHPEWAGELIRDSGIPAALSGKTWKGETALTGRDGREIPVSQIIFTHTEPNGKIQYLSTIARDISEQKRIEREREHYLARLNKLILVTTELLAKTGLEELLKHVVDAARELTGARLGIAGHGLTEGRFQVGVTSQAEGLRLRPFKESFHVNKGGLYLDALNQDSIRLNDKQLRSHPSWWGLPEDHVPLNGLLGARLISRDGRANGLIMLSDKERGDFTSEDEVLLKQLASITSLALQHIEARNEAQARAAEAEYGKQILDALMGNIPEGIAIASAPELKILMISDYGQEITGRSREVTVGIPFEQQMGMWEMYYPDGKTLLHPENFPLARAILTGEVVCNENLILAQPDGTKIPILCNATPLRDANGAITGAILAWRDITELKRAEEALHEASRRKDEFLAMLAHELRNPLAPIRNAVQVLRLTGPNDPTIQRQREVIDRQVGHMARLLDDLLDVSRITCGKIHLQKNRVDLCGAIDHAIETTRSFVAKGGHELSFERPGEPIWVDADPTRLEQVVCNLLNNAIKYTEPGGRIWVSCAPETRGDGLGEPAAVLRVQDTGIGIDPEMLPRIFDLFTQANQSLDRSQGGLGIGLTLVHRIVAMHGGTVEAHSDGPGAGSEFVVRLPLTISWDGNPQEAPRHISPPGPAGGGNGQQHPPAEATLKILVVDDNMDEAFSLAELLELWGFQTRVAHDGHTALELATLFRPGVILLDIGLPGMNGYQVAQCLRGENLLDATLLVALTGYGQDGDRRHAEEAGFDRHFTKPVNLEELHSLLDQTLKSLASDN